jgi:hypothetical protein
MLHRILSVMVMGTICLVLFTMLSFLIVGQLSGRSVWLWSSWSVVLAVTLVIVWFAATPRNAWGYMSLLGGIIALMVFLVGLFVPVSASTPYEPEADWLRSIDFTPPINRGIRMALASGYFTISVCALGLVLLVVGYFVLGHRPGRKHQEF